MNWFKNIFGCGKSDGELAVDKLSKAVDLISEVNHELSNVREIIEKSKPESITDLKREFIDSQKKILDLENNVDKKVLFNLCSDMENVLENAYGSIDGMPKLEVDFNGFKVGDFVKWKFCGKDYFVFIIKLTEKEIELACGEHHFAHTCVSATMKEMLEAKATKLF